MVNYTVVYGYRSLNYFCTILIGICEIKLNLNEESIFFQPLDMMLFKYIPVLGEIHFSLVSLAIAGSELPQMRSERCLKTLLTFRSHFDIVCSSRNLDQHASHYGVGESIEVR